MTTPRPLGLEDSLDLDDHCSNLRKIEEEKLDAVIQLFSKREGVSIEVAHRVRLEFLRFFCLLFFVHDPLAPAHIIRRFWVTFASLNEDYASFIGRHFQHFTAQVQVPQGDVNFPEVYVKHTEQLLARHFPTYDKKLWQMTP